MTASLDPTRAVHTWSLFDLMGRYVAPGSVPSGHLEPCTDGGGLDLLDLPAALRDHGFTSAQLCHFYLPRTEPAYLAEVTDAFTSAGVDIEVLLVDDGDLVHPQHGAQQLEWLSGWIDVAERLGCTRVRVPAGMQAPTDELLTLSARRLRELAARQPGIRLLTENWLDLLTDADVTRTLLERAEGSVGLLIDTGNWTAPHKNDQIRQVAGSAEACQLKGRERPDGTLDAADLTGSLQALADAGYTGRLSLVHEGEEADEWGRLEEIAALCTPFTSPSSSTPSPSPTIREEPRS